MEILNKEALRQYEQIETYEAGVALTGAEVKSIRGNRILFHTSFCKFIGNELYWLGAEIPPYKYARVEGYDPLRNRKLLLEKRELVRLRTKLSEHSSLTVVVLKCYTKGNFLKLKIALSKGRKAHELKSVEKERDIKRNDLQMAKEFLKS